MSGLLDYLDKDYFKFEDIQGVECTFCNDESFMEIGKNNVKIYVCKDCFVDLKRIRNFKHKWEQFP